MKEKERDSNYELLRIIAMLMIVLSHAVYHGVVKVGHADAYELWNTGNLLYKGISSISVLGAVGVGIFFMISGYFTAHKSNTSIKKVCLTVLFYAALVVVVTIITKVFGMQLYNSKGDLILNTAQLIMVPITGSVWWFTTAYIVMMLIAPIYNKFLDRMNMRGIKMCLLLLLVFGYGLGNLGSHFHDLEKALFSIHLDSTLGEYLKQ